MYYPSEDEAEQISKLITEPEPKDWYKSKTVWANVLSTTVAVLSLLGAHPLLAEYSEHVLLAVGVLNVLLRFVTDQPVTTPAIVRRVRTKL